MSLHVMTIDILIKMIEIFPCETRRECEAVADY